MIKLYVYRLSDGLFLYEYVGSTSGVIHDLRYDKDFTLTPPPDSTHQWVWIDTKWVKAIN